MKKICVLLISLLLITNIVVLYCYYNWGRVDSVTSYELKIDSLDKENELLSIENKKLNIFIDSLSEEISKTDSVIIRVDKWYEKNLDDLTSLPDSGQLQFFTDYLSKNSSRFSSSHNNDPVKTN